LGASVQGVGRRRRQRIRHDRLDHRAGPPAQRRRAQKNGGDEAIGRSRGGLSTKIHALVDALGNPTAFLLTAGQAHDLAGADCFLPQLKADALLADKAFDADKRVIEPLQAAGITPVIPSVPGRSMRRAYDRDLYKQRHLIENFFCKLKQFRAVATRYDKRAVNFLAGIYAASILIWLN
jgi:transposase